MGGTELLPALKDVVVRRSTNVPSTQIITLTDGQIWSANEAVDFVQQTRSRLGDELRLFVVGIGDTVSHRVIEGISEAGRGFGDVVGIATPDKWQDRVIRMLKGALMPPIWNCQLDLGSQFTRRDLYKDGFILDNKQRTPNTQSYIQATQSPSAHHFKQSSVFFLLDTGPKTALSSVTVTAAPGTNQGDSVTVTLPVLSTATPDRTLQHLAVKSALLDLDSRADQQQTTDANGDSVTRRNAVSLGTMYSVTSMWTSFVATNCEGSVDRPIDSYDATAGDLHLLTMHRPSTVPEPWKLPLREFSNCVLSLPPSQLPLQGFSDCVLSLPPSLSSLQESYLPPSRVSYSPLSPSALEFALPGFALPESESGIGLDIETLEMSYPVSRLDMDQYSADTITERRAPASRDRSRSASRRVLEHDNEQSIKVDDIVKSQTASGRFKIDSNMRQALLANLLTGTRDSIQATMTERSEEDAAEAVDTVMMTKCIETKLDDKKDLLELMVNKANRSVGAADSNGTSGSMTGVRKSDGDEHEHESEEEEEEKKKRRKRKRCD